MNQDPYCYPGTDVLRNKLGIHDAPELRDVESRVVRLKTAALRAAPVPGLLDLRHLQDIHRFLFEDIYDWAGELRTVSMDKDGFPFANPQFVAEQADRLFGALADEGYLYGLERNEFSDRAAWYLGEINAIHPFREGNGRAQREFLRHLAAESGWAIDWDAVNPAENIRASIHAMTADHSLLADIIRRNIGPPED